MSNVSPRDVFLHLLAIIALYISAISFIALVFQFIDSFFPDPLSYAPHGSKDAIRWALASLTVVFPVYVWASWFLAKDAAAHPEKRELKLRKWLYHFTLFAASAVMISDAVALIYRFLGGDLSIRFLLKVLAILFVAIAVFGYYLWYLRKEEMASKNPRMRLFVLVVVIVVLASVIYGFFAAGSPFRERVRRFDERRVQDLQSIQWRVVDYWRKKGRLPENLDELHDAISGYAVPMDPEGNASYEYHTFAFAPLKFRLCANFKTESGALDGQTAPEPMFFDGRSVFDNWRHGAGRACFERTIDPELYPPLKEPKRQ